MPSKKREVLSHVQDVVHYRQSYDWDCGVSCVLMLLSQEDREVFISNFDSICEEEGFGQSTWTIDLCYLMKRFGIKHRMYTTMIGVNEDYRCKSYYNKIIDIDRQRITRKFKMAAANSIEVLEQQVTMEVIVDHLLNHGLVIMLVDAGILACDDCGHNKLKAEFRQCFGGAYRGHYILIVGIRGAHLVYRDPARAPRLCAATQRSIARAAQAQGTDDDCILVYNDR